MSEPCDGIAACAASPEPCRGDREACLALLAAIIEHAAGDARGLAIFLLDQVGVPGDAGPLARRPLDDAIVVEATRRIRAAAPAWHRLLRGEQGEFIVIAQGLVDGGTVLGTAARLVHAFDEALQGAEPPLHVEVSVGIAFAPQHGARAEALLAAAQASLREATIAARRGQRRRTPSLPPSGSTR